MHLFFAVIFGPCPFPMLGLGGFELVCLRALYISGELVSCHVSQMCFSSLCFDLPMVLFPCKSKLLFPCLFLNIWRINET